MLRYANRAAERLIGRTPAELLGRPVAVLCSGARDLDAVLSALDTRDDAVALDLTLRRRDGSKLAVAAAASPVPPESGFPHGLILSLRDDTASRVAYAEIQRKNADLENCVNTLAHDLRSPLVALLGFSRLLRQDYGARLDDTGLHFVDRIEQAGRTMESLIHDLLELSRIGQPGERRSMVDPRAVLQQLHAELKPRLDAGGIELLLPPAPAAGVLRPHAPLPGLLEPDRQRDRAHGTLRNPSHRGGRRRGERTASTSRCATPDAASLPSTSSASSRSSRASAGTATIAGAPASASRS